MNNLIDQRTLSVEISTSIKGISAIEIMIGHIGIATGLWFLYPNRKAGILFVGIFFMLSGYGLMYNYINKSDYRKRFLFKRIFSVFFPAYIVYLLYGLADFWLEGKWTLGVMLHYIFLDKFVQKTSWFVFEILFFYILFWFLYRFFSNNVANIFLCTVVILIIGGGYFCRVDNPWYGSSFCFPVGILYAQKEKMWNAVLNRHYFIKNLALLLVCGICIIVFFMLGNDSLIGNPIARNLASVSFCLWVLSLLQKIKIDYQLLQWFGKISYEIFLLHPFWIYIIGKYIIEPWSFIVLVIVLTIFSSILLYIPIARIQKKLNWRLIN